MTVDKTTGMTLNMAMLGREVMMPAALIDRPQRSHTVPRCRLSATCAIPISGCEMPLDRRPGRRKCIMMSVRNRPCLPKANLFGCFGRDHRSARNSASSSDSGLDLGASNRLSRHWWWCSSTPVSALGRLSTWTACCRAIRYHQPCLNWTPGSLPTLRRPRTDRIPPTEIASLSLGWMRAQSWGDSESASGTTRPVRIRRRPTAL